MFLDCLSILPHLNTDGGRNTRTAIHHKLAAQNMAVSTHISGTNAQQLQLELNVWNPVQHAQQRLCGQLIISAL